MTTAVLAVDGLCLHHAGQPVVQDVCFALAPGELACLLGPSGCGKTTLLRACAGLHPPSAGHILLRGTESDRPHWQLPAEQRRLGMVFQDLALFPHLDVHSQLELALRGWDAARRRARVAQLVRDFQLDGLERRRPHELSGGQQQRVALARALAAQTDLVLLDEPFSSLDARLKAQMNRWLRGQLKAYGAAALLVSHDQEEALVFADRIGVMQHGRLLQWGPPRQVYERPATRAVAEFLGEARLLPATRDSGDRWRCALGVVTAEADAGLQQGALLLRPELLTLRDTDDATATPAVVVHGEYRGGWTCWRVQLPGEPALELQVAGTASVADGQVVGVGLRDGVRPLVLAG